MLKAVTSEQMRQIDRVAIEQYGIPGIILMENAALAVVEKAAAYLRQHNGHCAAVICGKGNNGGDGMAVARHLHQRGFDVRTYILSDPSQFTGDAALNYNILYNINAPITVLSYQDAQEAWERFYADLQRADMIIDALFGTGIKGEIQGLAADVVKAINESGKYILAVDMPSGVNGDSGAICGCAVKADETVTFCLPKIGQLIYPGKEYTGLLTVADICIPRAAVNAMDIDVEYITVDDVRPIMPKRHADSHKGDYGHVLVIGGSVGFSGAPLMAAQAALKSGAGLVTLAVPYSIYDIAASSVKEVMVRPLEYDGQGRISARALDSIIVLAEKADTIIIGPGMQVYDDVFPILRNIIKDVDIPIVLDADALNAISQQKEILRCGHGRLILTPHPGEMSRLTGLPAAQVQQQRLKTARDFAVAHDAVVVLKGAATVTACPDGRIYINSTGNAGMATAGSGDVLTGVIAALIGQHLPVDRAAYAGAFIHGMAGDMAAERQGLHGLISGDIINGIPSAIKYIYTH